MSTRRPVLTPVSQLSGDVLVGPWASQKPARRDVSVANAETGAATTVPFYYILWQNKKTGDRVLWPMNGTSRAGADIMLPREDTVWDMAAIADFTGDGDAEIVLQNRSTGNRGMWSLKGTTWNSFIQLYGENPVWDFAAAADFTGDSQPDVLMQNTATGDRGFWLMDHAAYRGWAAAPTEQPVWRMVAAADFTGDAKPDVLFENESTGQRGVWVMNGTTYQSWASFPSEQTVWEMAAAHDVTGDGKPDIFFQNKSTGLRGWWIMNGTQYQTWVGLGTVAPEWDIVGAFTPAGTHVDPQAPSLLNASRNPTGPLHLIWQDNSSSETYFEVQRSLGKPDEFVLVAQLPPNSSSYDDPRTGTAQNTFYRVRACNASGCTAWSPVYEALGSHLNLVSPAPGTFADDTTTVRVTVTGGLEVVALTAIVDGREFPLTLKNGEWRGALSLTGLASGEKFLLLAERDGNGAVDTTYMPFVLDRRPRIDVLSPPPGGVVQTTPYHVTVACTDMEGACTSIKLYWYTADGSGSDVVRAQGTNRIEADLPLPADQTVTFRVDATDQKGQHSIITQKVLVETSPRLTAVESAGIEVWQLAADRILYVDSTATGRSLNIRDRATGAVTVIYQGGVKSPEYRIPYMGYLTLAGAAYIDGEISTRAGQSGDRYEEMHDWRNGVREDLGSLPDGGVVKATPGWIIWKDGGALYRRNVATGEIVRIYNAGGIFELSINDQGDVSYLAYTQAYLYHDGVTTPQASYTDFEFLKNGRYAFVRTGGSGVQQIFVREAGGTERQVTSFAQSSFLESLGPNGEVVFRSGGRHYVALPTGSPIDIGVDFGVKETPRSYWIDGSLYVALGRTVFRVQLQ
ncbi:MAG TPA: VCBS repeat-containing protein [Longimicrobiaceae bacterium]|jgi:hypothetical protein|nr:VCBS repeat-containing protein [Longimicrobiaceae bacterium]